MISKSLALFAATAGVALYAMGCSPQLSGGGSDIDSFNGMVVLAPGEKPENVEVMLFEAEYLPTSKIGFSDTVGLDSSGRFYFDSIKNGMYNLYCRDTAFQSGAFIDSIIINRNVVSLSIPVRLDSVYIISGSGVSDSGKPLSGLVYINGSPFVSLLGNGNFIMKDVPRGSYRLLAERRFEGGPGGINPIILEYRGPEVIVHSDTTIVTTQVDWTKQ
jgi:hypothetical protein